MPASRRAFLAGSGLLAASGVGVWQRRRIVRYPELEAMREAADHPVPSFEAGVPVADAHLEAAHDRTAERIEEFHATVADEHNRSSIADIGERHDAESPSELESATRAERREALDSYRSSVRSAAGIFARERFEDRELDRTDAAERVETERAALAAVERSYRGESLTDAVVANGQVDERHLEASYRIDSAENRDLQDGLEFSWSWRDLVTADVHRRDAERHARGVDGDDYEERLDAALENALEAVEESVDGVDWGHEDAERNYAAFMIVGAGPFGGRHSDVSARESRAEGGYLASGLQLAVYHHVHYERLDALAEIPDSGEWAAVGWTVDADALPERKRAAVAAIEEALEAHDDPLVRWLLASPADTLEQADDRLGRQIDGANDADDEQWQRSINEYYARCLEAETFATQVPTSVEALLE
ncbi:hypothetical protein [Natrononativus amylolyticus]|uniref:hypothetical protein n=1 Tax=Natrononativus amylolyticus TaxID=2963434 RepID=UPI0020CD0D99|nr:hypothetical protein [Natrononativus amylolyticus]